MPLDSAKIVQESADLVHVKENHGCNSELLASFMPAHLTVGTTKEASKACQDYTSGKPQSSSDLGGTKFIFQVAKDIELHVTPYVIKKALKARVKSLNGDRIYAEI